MLYYINATTIVSLVNKPVKKIYRTLNKHFTKFNSYCCLCVMPYEAVVNERKPCIKMRFICKAVSAGSLSDGEPKNRKDVNVSDNINT